MLVITCAVSFLLSCTILLSVVTVDTTNVIVQLVSTGACLMLMLTGWLPF